MDIRSLGSFYVWADKRIIKMLRHIPEEKFSYRLQATNRSLKDLSKHMIGSYEQFILFHLKNKHIGMKELEDLMNSYNSKAKEELLNYWHEIVVKFSHVLKEVEIDAVVEVPSGKQSLVKVPYEEVIFSYTDHSTYHRGQLITTLKVLTGQEVSNTDYYTYLVTQKKDTAIEKIPDPFSH